MNTPSTTPSESPESSMQIALKWFDMDKIVDLDCWLRFFEEFKSVIEGDFKKAHEIRDLILKLEGESASGLIKNLQDRFIWDWLTSVINPTYAEAGDYPFPHSQKHNFVLFKEDHGGPSLAQLISENLNREMQGKPIYSEKPYLTGRVSLLVQGQRFRIQNITSSAEVFLQDHVGQVYTPKTAPEFLKLPLLLNAQKTV